MGLLTIFLGGVATTSFVAGFRYIKQWYLKEQKNIQLQKENAESQLQLLTAQVHPHFLFNTLNNIYSQTQTESPKGSKMIMELSDMLRYILTEGSKALVPLQKELVMIQDYINLEKIRYGNKLDLHLSIPPNSGHLQIAPLMLLPFIENCFKHGASKFLNAPWINLKIEINGKALHMKLINGKTSEHLASQQRPGTGIGNVKKRLELQYPGKYALQINDDQEVFIVNLKMELTTDTSMSANSNSETHLSYA
ncbi:sensor histidine kinase [Flavihumibacter sp. ZG627]|uniref:sensor histidine kinase n=1 Tax=Flavihumibacter sp. ZG627 TaxID=1463156 RepID=UPI0006940B1B|nr:histidine kinase [Flavihumibacter sp. ZG627]